MGGEPKTFASLSGGLLARKGGARPAMRPQGFGQVGQGLDDLGWNDMGDGESGEDKPNLQAVDGDMAPFEPKSKNMLNGLTPAVSPVHEQRASIVGRLSGASAEDFDEEEEYIDETAELYDPDAEEDTLELEEELEEDYASDEIESPMAFDVPEPVAEIAPEPLVKPKKQPMFTAENAPGPVDSVVAALQAAQGITPIVAEEPVAEAAPIYEVAEPIFESPEPVVEAMPEPVAVAPAPKRAPRARSAPGSKGKAAFTLRLDKARHLKLRLACAVRGQSAQAMVTDALDAFLATLPELDQMAEKARERGE